MIENKDWPNWEKVMSQHSIDNSNDRQITTPRPGHADLSGGIKYRHRDLRNVLERASARETAMRVAVVRLPHFSWSISAYIPYPLSQLSET